MKKEAQEVMNWKSRVITIIIYLTWLFILFVSIYDIFFNAYRSIIWISSLIILILLFIYLTRIPRHVHILFSVIVMLNIFGELFFRLYYIWAPYDKILHTIIPLILCIFIYDLSKGHIKSKTTRVIFALSVVLALATIWEIIEYGFDQVFNSYMQGVNLIQNGSNFFGSERLEPVVNKINDTMGDLICGFAGAIVFAVGNIFYKKRERLERI